MKKAILASAGLAILLTVVMWLPFWLRISSLPGWGLDFSGGMEVVFANFDGPNYLIVAKSWYDKATIGTTFSNPLLLEYYPAHLPLYPAMVGLVDLVLPGTWSMLIVTLLGTVLAVSMWVKFLAEFKLTKKLMWMGVVFLLLPARWWVVRSVGSPEPWFIFFVLASIYNFKNKKYWLAGLFGALAQLTKSPGILLLAGYGLYLLWEIARGKKGAVKEMIRAIPVGMIGLVVIPLFYFYQVRTGDFWAYFNSGDNFHLFWPPFSIFSPKGQFWTGDFWLEEMIWLWIVYGLGVLKLWRKKLSVEAIFAGVFLLSTFFVAHRDISRYILPIFPLVLLGWEEEIVKKEFKWLMLLLVVPIMLYSWNFMINNVSPVDNWGPYL